MCSATTDTKHDFFLGEEKFRTLCMEIVKHSQTIGDDWEWISLKEEQEDDSSVQVSQDIEVIHYEYHVLYSISYQAPVLYFRASFLDGRPLTLDEIWQRVHECYKPQLLNGPWETITQQEHPILGQPFFVLHPCRTNEFMSLIHGNTSRNGNYITSWLSIVGPVVGLMLPLSYGKAM
ncbi:ubiquitin-like-conjugating enzyme ATG10 isoform X2 [Pelobates fuscus]|uniref:ubiquitin-like-conjugating enzyme ATG10 isoform X2 n=1 Tax=Pelobates fuscus TaxID=191477 RepID=UPI002FE4542C